MRTENYICVSYRREYLNAIDSRRYEWQHKIAMDSAERNKSLPAMRANDHEPCSFSPCTTKHVFDKSVSPSKFHRGSRHAEWEGGGERVSSVCLNMDDSDLIVKFYVPKPTAWLFCWQCYQWKLTSSNNRLYKDAHWVVLLRYLLICRYHLIHFLRLSGLGHLVLEKNDDLRVLYIFVLANFSVDFAIWFSFFLSPLFQIYLTLCGFGETEEEENT